LLREVVDVIAWAMQCVRGNHHPARIADLVQHRREPGDLIGLRVDVGLG
jgi:hypothetical protein